jgi:hypothetical protein
MHHTTRSSSAVSVLLAHTQKQQEQATRARVQGSTVRDKTKGKEKEKALLLGMVYSEEQEPKRGQEFRDRVRCSALENRGQYEIFTLDNKHNGEDARQGKHCRANFADQRRMISSMRRLWGDDIGFDIVILDYFFSPVCVAESVNCIEITDDEAVQ